MDRCTEGEGSAVDRWAGVWEGNAVDRCTEGCGRGTRWTGVRRGVGGECVRYRIPRNTSSSRTAGRPTEGDDSSVMIPHWHCPSPQTSQKSKSRNCSVLQFVDLLCPPVAVDVLVMVCAVATREIKESAIE